MQQSSQAMLMHEPVAAKANATAKDRLPLLSLLTFSPMGNPLAELSAGQRKLMFDYLLMSLHNQRKEQLERISALNKGAVLPVALSSAAISLGTRAQEERWRIAAQKEAEGKKAREELSVSEARAKKIADGKKSYDAQPPGAAGAQKMTEAQSYAASEKEERHKIVLEQMLEKNDAPGQGGEGAAGPGLAGIRFTRLLHAKEEAGKGVEIGGAGPASEEKGWQGSGAAPREKALAAAYTGKAAKEMGGEGGSAGAASAASAFSSVFGQKSALASNAIGQLAPVIDDYARGSEEKERRVVENLHNHVRSQSYVTDDLMASLLLVIEDDAWAGEEGGLGASKPHGGMARLHASTAKIAALVPEKLRSTAQDSAVVRLASVREMLRYYFLAHPKDYHVALAAALGITSDEGEDVTFMQERLASMLASIGSFALAQKILAELKKKKKMDTAECLLRLGYRYDVKKRRLVLGKRTCGRPVEARGIIGLLLASARKE